MPDKPAWHSISIEDTAGRLGANLTSGLSSVESADRLERFGRNVLAEPDGTAANENTKKEAHISCPFAS